MLALCITLASLLAVGYADFPGSCDSNPTRCSCIYTDTVTKAKMIIDLAPLSTDGSFKWTELRGSDQSLYFYNPCSDETLQGLGSCQSVIGCQHWIDEFVGLGKLDTSRFTTEQGKIMIQSSHNEAIANRIMHVFLDCREDIIEPVVTADGDLAVRFTYVFNIAGKDVCPRLHDTDNGKPIVMTIDVTPGTIMCIVALVGGLMYIVVGIVVQRFHFQKTGKEMLPNYTFWVLLPSLIKGGALFVKEKILSLAGRGEGSDGEYEKL